MAGHCPHTFSFGFCISLVFLFYMNFRLFMLTSESILDPVWSFVMDQGASRISRFFIPIEIIRKTDDKIQFMVGLGDLV